MRNEGLLKIVPGGRMEGKRTRGRPSMVMIHDLMKAMYAKDEEKGRRPGEIEDLDAYDLPIGIELMMIKRHDKQYTVRLLSAYTPACLNARQHRPYITRHIQLQYYAYTQKTIHPTYSQTSS